MRVAFDIGGTFTDVLIEHGGQLHAAKLLSLLDRVGDDIAAQVRDLGGGWVDRFIHATTTCSNALIERKFARCALLTTRGFRDVLEMRNQQGPPAGGLDWAPPEPIIPRDRRFEIDERIAADGSVVLPLDEAQAKAEILALRRLGVEAVAVCLLNSYENAAHERRLAELLAEHAPDVVVCLSCDVHPEIREYERTSTTVINTCLVPVVTSYLDRLEAQLAPIGRDVLIMQSNGGLMSSPAARRRPMHIVESGPAAGVLAAARLARDLGLDRVISFDMGGTTAKACLIRNGAPLERAGGEVGSAEGIAGDAAQAGHALRAPMIDLVEVGAGGGSIGWVDEGLLRVGPRSAGAEPGPACYGRGGTAPTVTDANVVLGRLNPVAIADGTLPVDRTAAERAIDRIAEPLGFDRLTTADGIVRVANAVMSRAIRAVSIERGYDPREFTLLTFGGAGSLHAAALAEEMGVTRIVVPPVAGLFSALGLLVADYRFDYLRSVAKPLDDLDPDLIDRGFSEMETNAREEMGSLKVPIDELRFERRVDVRYAYQVEDLMLDAPKGAIDVTALGALFEQAHQTEFGYVGEGRKILTTLRLRVIAPGHGPVFSDFELDGAAAATTPVRRTVHFGAEHGTIDTPVLTRAALTGPGQGPVIIEDRDTTIVVPPGWQVEPGRFGTLLISR